MLMPLVLTNRRRRGGSASAPAFSPLSLFSGGSQGIWLDPSDLTTMFSDRAGTTPVTTPGTVVGLRLDKSGRGNHATAPTDAARPIYGVEPKGGRRNLLTWSEGFDNAVWIKFNPPTITPDDTAAPNGTVTADRVIAPNGNKTAIYQPSSAVGVPARRGIYAKFGTARFLWMEPTSNTPTVWFDLQNGTVSSNTSGGTASITAVGDGWYLCSVAVTASATNFSFGFSNASGSDGQTSGQYSWVWGAQLELGSTATNYQRVTTAYDITESGVATTHYVQYDGSDDSMSTAAIDFTGTDKMSVFAGVRKLSDAALGVVVELSATVNSNNGSFALYAPQNAGVSNYGFSSKGTAAGVATGTGFAAPVSTLISASGDIAGDNSTLRANGAQVAQTTTDQGTGNFGNYPLFIGRRNNTSAPFNGKDYGIVIVGKAASTTEITDTETWLAAKTSGVTI